MHHTHTHTHVFSHGCTHIHTQVSSKRLRGGVMVIGMKNWIDKLSLNSGWDSLCSFCTIAFEGDMNHSPPSSMVKTVGQTGSSSLD